MYIKLKMKLVEKNISLEAAANVIGVHRNTFSAKIQGKTKFTIDELLKIRDTFFPDVTLDELAEKHSA